MWPVSGTYMSFWVPYGLSHVDPYCCLYLFFPVFVLTSTDISDMNIFRGFIHVLKSHPKTKVIAIIKA